MSKKLYKGTISIAAIIWISCFALFLQVMYGYFSKQYTEKLRAETELAAGFVNMYGTDGIENLNASDTIRITLIDTDGTVMYDSRSDASAMENHADREEVKAAFETGAGECTRYSATLSEKTSYYAVKLDNGEVLRLSSEYYSVLLLVMGMGQPLAVLAILSIVLAVVLSYRITKSIIKPINEIDLEDPQTDGIYEELTPLVARIRMQNAQIKRQMEELKYEHDEQEKMRDEFTANVSHELKTPLTSISGYAEIIKNGMVGQGDVERFAGKIYDEARRLITLVEDIMKLSQLDEKALPAQKEDIDLYEACLAVTEHLKPAAEEKNIKMMLTGEHAIISGVDQVIDEMIFNLCDNAIKYNKEGGAVVITVTDDETCSAFSVEDTGIGIPEEDFDRIFERFYMVNKSHSRKIGGTGLGLSIVKHGARYHNARIEVKSALGKGTKITVIFPKEKNFANI